MANFTWIGLVCHSGQTRGPLYSYIPGFKPFTYQFGRICQSSIAYRLTLFFLIRDLDQWTWATPG